MFNIGGLERTEGSAAMGCRRSPGLSRGYHQENFGNFAETETCLFVCCLMACTFSTTRLFYHVIESRVGLVVTDEEEQLKRSKKTKI